MIISTSDASKKIIPYKYIVINHTNGKFPYKLKPRAGPDYDQHVAGTVIQKFPRLSALHSASGDYLTRPRASLPPIVDMLMSDRFPATTPVDVIYSGSSPLKIHPPEWSAEPWEI